MLLKYSLTFLFYDIDILKYSKILRFTCIPFYLFYFYRGCDSWICKAF